MTTYLSDIVFHCALRVVVHVVHGFVVGPTHGAPTMTLISIVAIDAGLAVVMVLRLHSCNLHYSQFR